MVMSKKKFENLTWYNIEEPDNKAIFYLKKKFKFHELDLEDCLSENERPKLDDYSNYVFIILHFPVYISKTKRVVTTELKIFVGQNYIVTLHEGDLKALNDLYKLCGKTKSKTEYMGQGSGYLLYEIITACYNYCFPLVDKTSRNIRLVEKDLFLSDDNQQGILQQILIVKRNIINISRILLPQSNILTKLEAKNKKFLPENLEVYFDDIKDTSDKIKDILILNREVINVLHGIHESLISERTNRVMKLLTVFSVIMLPLTFLTGLWGMNVELPFADNPLAFWAVGTIMTALMGFMVIVFKIKKWI